MDEATLARFWARVDKNGSGGCWLWTGWKTANGYGKLRTTGGARYAHRLSREHHAGVIPEGLCVCHRCDVPARVNPDHLFLGTHADNMRDSWRKGRSFVPTEGPRVRPERRARGERHGSRTKPERVPRGERQGAAKLTDAQVREIRALANQGVPQRRIGARHGVTQSLVSLIVRRKVWTHV